MNATERIHRDTIVLPERREIHDWAAERVDFGNRASFKGKFDVNNAPWTREIYRAWKNPYVREITVVMPPQESGKTIAAEVCMGHTIATRPGKLAFNVKTNVKADHWWETRWKQMLVAMPSVVEKLSSNPHDTKKRKIIFADGTWLVAQGAEEDANRQSDSVEYQINDECHLWERPWLSQMHSRLRAYKETRKILNISVGGMKNSELEDRFLAGNQLEWHHHCPACGQPFRYVFDSKNPKCNIRFDLTKVVVHKDGRLDLREFGKTVHVVCPLAHCGHRIDYDEDLLARLNRNGVFIAMNPDANPEVVSMHANSFAIGRRHWADILEPWVRMSINGGVFATEIVKAFICEELAEFYEERPIVVTKELKLGSYRRADVLAPKSWKDEWIRVIAADNQRGSQGDIPHRWFVCRAFSRPDGAGKIKSRLIDCGRLNEWSELRAKQKELGVPDWTVARPGPWVVVDRRYDPTTVDEVCAKYKWFGMMGSDRDEFLHSSSSPHDGKLMLFTEPRAIDIGFGTKEQGRLSAIYYLWASHKVQDILANLRAGKGGDYEVPSDINDFCPEYAEHINSHRSHIEVDRNGRERRVWKAIGGWPDHLYDCESEIAVLGLMAGLFKTE